VDKKMSKSDLRKRQKLRLTRWKKYVVMKLIKKSQGNGVKGIRLILLN